MKFRGPVLVILLVGWALALPVALRGSADEASPGSPPAVRLQPGVPLEGEARTAGLLTFEWTGSPAPWRIAVEQDGADVALTVRAPDGQVLAATDAPTSRRGPEVALLDLPAAGTYRLELRPLTFPGRFVIQVDAVADLPPEIQERLPAETAINAAVRLAAQGDPESRRRAGAEYQKALDLWHAQGRTIDEARTLICRADLLRKQGELERGRELLRQALALWQGLREPLWEATTLDLLGLTFWQGGDARAARPYFEQALEIERSQADRLGAATSLNNLCLTDQAAGELQQALACYRQVLDDTLPAGTEWLSALVLHNLGNVQDALGEPDAAFDSYRQALALHRRMGNRQGEAGTLNSIAVLHRRLGEPQEALDRYGEALAIQRELHDIAGEGSSLGNIGYAYYSLGDLQRAQVYLEQSLALRRQAGDRRGEATTLGNLGLVHRELGETDRALALFQQSLDLRQQLGDAGGQASLLRVMGETYSALGGAAGAAQAAASLDRALRLTRSDDEGRLAAILETRAGVEMAAGDLVKARDDLRSALASYRRLRNPASEAQALERLAQAERRLGELASARQHVEQSLEVIEALRTRVASPELRAAFLASQRRAYELAIDLAMAAHAADPAQGIDRTALAASERARARILVEMLGETSAAIRKGLDPALHDREQSLRRRLQAKTDRQVKLLQAAHTEEQAAAAELDRYQALAELERLEAEIRRANPSYAELTRPVALGAAEVQQLLDPGTLLLEYSLGEERSFLWAVTAGEVRSFVLPRRAEIEALAGRVRESMSALQAGTAPRQRQDAADLTRILLGPVEEPLASSQRLIVVADGALHYIPFAALPSLEGDGPLVLRHEVAYLPSASALAEARRLSGRRQPTRQVAILADPVFERGDPRLGGGVPKVAQGVTPLQVRSAELAEGAADLQRLPATRKEAEAIAALLPPDQVLKALDFAARRSVFLDGELKPYRVIHLATHGLIDSRRPELSSLVLSRFDEKGQPQEGDLRLQDLYNLDLNADLVVLSGCSTALGREVRGEGLVGITRGFLYAGVPRVVASLWNVQDRATAELMTHFYRALLLEHQPPAAALRTAQLAVMRQPRWRSPYYWAAFIPQGEWR